MNWPSRDNVLSMRAKTLPTVITPFECKGGQNRGAVVLTMKARAGRVERKRAVVVEMPSGAARAEKGSLEVLQMPARNSNDDEALETGSRLFRDGIRMTLVALFALLGWPRPTHGKDPGAASARPWKLELLNVTSKLQIPATAARHAAARGPVLEFPRHNSDAFGADLASAA